MRQRVFWTGTILAAAFVFARAAGEQAPVSATVPIGGAVAQAVRPHAFGGAQAAARKALPAHGSAYLSMVAGGGASPAVAAVREEGKLRLVRKGDTLGDAVIAAIAPEGLTLRRSDKTFILAKAAR